MPPPAPRSVVRPDRGLRADRAGLTGVAHESDRAQDNEYLGTLIVPDLPPGTKGNVVFDIIFNISAESILTVTAEERGTARTVTATFSTQDSPEAVRRRLGAPEPPRLDEPDKGKMLGWVKRVFGQRTG